MNGEAYCERCAGIDVHKKLLVVRLRIGRKPEVRELGTLTHEIREIVAWRKENGCRMAGMESSGPCWKSLHNIFGQEGTPAMACDAYHIKNAPGRKTDVGDARWIARCLSQGLLNPGFAPGREQRELRDMTRFRKPQIEERSRNINRLQKFPEGANVKLGSRLSNIEGKSATALLELVTGKPDFTIHDVAEPMHGGMKATARELLLSLEGPLAPSRREFFAHVMAIIREQTAQIEKTDAMLQRSLSDNCKAAVKALDAIPGIGRVSAEQILAETGADYYTQFNREKKINSHVRRFPSLACPSPMTSCGMLSRPLLDDPLHLAPPLLPFCRGLFALQASGDFSRQCR